MKQLSLANTGSSLQQQRIRRREFRDETNLVIRWPELLALVASRLPGIKTGQPTFPAAVKVRIPPLQQFSGHSDPAMETALHDETPYREFARIDASTSPLPDESTILRFGKTQSPRLLLEEHHLGQQILATNIATLTSRGL